MVKRGKLNEVERTFIETKMSVMTAAELGEKLNRSEEIVQEFMESTKEKGSTREAKTEVNKFTGIATGDGFAVFTQAASDIQTDFQQAGYPLTEEQRRRNPETYIHKPKG